MEGDEQPDRPKSQKVRVHKSNHTLFCVCHKHNSLPHGPIQPSSPTTKSSMGRCLEFGCSFLHLKYLCSRAVVVDDVADNCKKMFFEIRHF